MTAPLSLRDKQYQYLLGLYGPGLSYNDMLSQYRGSGKSISDLEYAAYLGDPTKSLADNMDTMIPGSGSLSDQMYADSSGGVTVAVNPITDGPTPLYSFWAGDPSVVVNDGDLITNWKSLSNAGGAGRPTYRKSDAAINGKPSLQYTANLQYLQQDIPDVAQPYYLVAICKSAGAVSTKNVIGIGSATIAASGLGIRSTGTWFCSANSTVDSLITDNNVPTLAVAKLAGAASDIQINSNVAVVGNALTEPANYFKLGVGGVGAAQGIPWVGSLAFAAIYTSDPRLDPKWLKILEFARSCGVNVPNPIDNLMATSFYVAHRGSGDVWPEHTATAYNNSLAAGLKGIEVSAQRSSDGWWFCLHDAGASGLDRTTNGTGDPKTFTQAQLNTYIVDIANCGPYWPLQNLKMPDLQTVLTSLLADPLAVIFLETKDYSGSAMDDMLAKIQLWFPSKYKTQIIWKSHVSNAAGFTKAKAAGMKCWAYLDYPLNTQQVTDALSRADYVGLPRYDNGNGLTDAEIDTAMSIIGANVKAICWEPKRRSEIAKLLSKGVDGFVSPPAPYTSIATANRTQDQFSTGQWAPGDLIRDTTVGAVLDSATASMFFNGATTGASVMLGSFCPIASTSYEINYEMKYDVVPAATSHSGLVFCKADDAKYAFGGASNTTGGYHIVMRQNGQLQLYKHDPGNATGTQVGTTLTTAALDTVTWCKVRVKVTPTSVEIQRMDGTPSTTMNVADTSYRGQYIHLSKNHASTTEFVRFRNVKVTLL